MKTLMSKQLAEIMRLVYLVNKRTPYCVFFNYSGHINSIDMKVAHNKTDYLKELAEVKQLSLNIEDNKERLELKKKLNKIAENLKKYLEPIKVLELDK